MLPPMRRARSALILGLILTVSVVRLPDAYAQATVETGGATAGAADNVTTLVPNFAGMSSAITSLGSATPTPTIAADAASPDQPQPSEDSTEPEGDSAD
jgi:hypothetical protein